jgi:60 kDa SS-A/Ro ribonucleoprotein
MEVRKMRTNRAVKREPVYTNEGARAVRSTPEQMLRRSVAACLLWEDSFYESGQAIANRIRDLITQCRPEFVAAVAYEARTRQHLRHIPLFIVREMARLPRHNHLVSDLLPSVIQRADEIAEFLALYWASNNDRKTISAQVKRGLAAAFEKFTEFDFAKYNRDAQVKLRDVLFLVHARPKDAVGRWDREMRKAKVRVGMMSPGETLYQAITQDTLAVPDTWEVALSGGADKKSTFQRLMAENKLGGLAFIRNLRNMQEAGIIPGEVAVYADRVNLDRVLPFRFITAARAVPQWEPIVEKMMLRCLTSADKLPGKTALVIDTSPSMWQAKVSQKSEMTRFDAAAAVAILLREICETCNVYAFNTQAYVVPARRGFALRDILEATKGNASRGGLGVEAANKDGYDRIIVLTDDQWHVMRGDDRNGYDPEKVCPKPLTDKAYMINVSIEKNAVGYGNWTRINGWSEAIVDYIQEIERPLEVAVAEMS